MIKKLLQHLKKNEIKTIVKNFFSLSSLNFISYIFPLILIPYIIHTVGLKFYGQYILSTAIITYCTLLVNYGFDFSATKLISINRDDKVKISEILINITAARIIFAFIATIAIILITLTIPNLTDNCLLYYLGIGILWGQAITPLWLFQGIEKMGYITLINVITRSISTLFIFVFIKSPEHFYLLNLFQSIGYLTSGIACFFMIRRYIGVHFIKPSLIKIKIYLYEAWPIFLSTLSMSFYREANVLILGLTTNYSLVGQYGAIEKIVKAMQSFIDPLAKALFPFFGRKFNNSKENIKLFFQFGKIYTILLLILTTILFAIGPQLILWYLGSSFKSAIIVFKILVPIILFGGLNYYFGIVGLINLGMDKYFLKSVIITGVFSITICSLLSLNFDIRGAAIAMVGSELLLLTLISKKIWNYRQI